MKMNILTSGITMNLVYKILDCVQVAIGTGQREWGVTSLVDCTCEHQSEPQSSIEMDIVIS